MEIRTRSGSSLFLTEMIISILFFSITAAFCIQIFVHAHLVSQRSEDLNHAQNLASSMVEAIAAIDGETDMISQYFPEACITENSIAVFYDDNWEICTRNEASYGLFVTLNEEKNMISGEVLVTNDILSPDKEENQLYELPFRHHIANTVTKEENFQ